MNTAPPQAASVLGVRVDCVDFARALGQCVALLAAQGHHQVVTLNPEFVMLAQRDAGFRGLVETAALVVPDGAGIVWALGCQGRQNIERVTGIDLMPALCVEAARLGASVFLLGAAPGVAERTGRVLQQQIPGLKVAGTAVGGPAPEQADALCKEIRSTGADILFVAFGCPAQDFWIERFQAETGARLAMGVGGSFDYISGKVPRAPRWLQAANLEWLYRLVRQPWRWRRQLALIRYLWQVVRQRQP